MMVSELHRDTGEFIEQALQKESRFKEVLISCLLALRDTLLDERRAEVDEVLDALKPMEADPETVLDVSIGSSNYILLGDRTLHLPDVVNPIPLTPSEYLILYRLMRNAGKICDKTMFESGGIRGLSTQVCRMNTKLREYGVQVSSARSRGYYFGDKKSDIKIIENGVVLT